ncbi:hypothetical protein K227x_12760 [Rubripirellula lacrimiformis]|uniref:Uncharacterized protein n=1 Tax=Rubripirellula lacrimiformis TaxID=1930273 RepID=A0A517N6Y1_9BACT|nr:hypothetical protein [Rubripirellula lacrimiformis]QDT02897.1 hypothetical protein K227x_12760 [Rubripirellula lacrimiformis]
MMNVSGNESHPTPQPSVARRSASLSWADWIRRSWIVVGALLGAVIACPAKAEEVFDLLGGFDRTRIDACYPVVDDDTAGELAKLSYRLQRIAPTALAGRATPLALGPDAQSDDIDIGSAVRFDGTIQSIDRIPVPPALVEYLEFSVVRSVQLQVDDAAIRVLSPGLVSEAKVGDRAGGVGVVIQPGPKVDSPQSPDADPMVLVAGRMDWMPSQSPSVGWQLLAETGVDLSGVAALASRNRKPLTAADGDAFYAILATSEQIGRRQDVPVPATVDAIELLTDPQAMAGQWIRMELETVQITRVTVTTENRIAQLHQDHYFQIDAVADLGNAVVKIEDDNHGLPDAVFENRYPVSVVTTELPAFLNEAIWRQTGNQSVLAEINRPVAIDGFFLRLWSYQTQYMKQFGGEDQFGPLIVAARVTDRAPASADPVGVSIIGWIAAVAVLVVLVATFLWHRITSAGDRKIRERQKRRESEDLDFPNP